MNKKIIHKCKILHVFAILFFVLLFSLMPFKVNAVNLTQSVSLLGTLSTSSTSIVRDVDNCTIGSSGGYPYATNNGTNPCSVGMTALLSSGTGFNNDYIWGVTTYVYEVRDREAIHSFINETPTLSFIRNSTIIDSTSFIGYNVSNVSESSVIVTYYFRSTTSGTITAGNTSVSFYSKFGLQQNEYMKFGRTIEVVSFSGGGGDNTQIINAINNMRIENNNWLSQINQNIQELRQSTIDNQGSVNNINQNIENSIDQTQQAADEGQTNSDSANSDNESASQNLIQVAGTIIGAFSSSATNCKLNADMGNVNLGTIDFCVDKPSAIIGVIDAAATILIAFAVYRIIRSLINRFISLTTYGQGGDNG